MKALKNNNLYANPSKCEFALEEIDYLGYLVSKKGISPNPDKVAAIANWPKLKNTRDVQSFLGLANYYRKFIKDFSKLAIPLTKLLQKNIQFEWKQEQDDAFNTLKQKLTMAPVLKLPTRYERFQVITDASNQAIGAVLEQREGKDARPIAYLSQKLQGSQINWSIRDKELYAIVTAL